MMNAMGTGVHHKICETPMSRLDLTRRLVSKLQQGEIVVAGIGNANFDLLAAGHRPQNFYMLGSMGLTVPVALGIALAPPSRRVFVIERDGSALMTLGALATVAMVAPHNLTVIIWDNGAYQITGGQPAATAGGPTLSLLRGGPGSCIVPGFAARRSSKGLSARRSRIAVPGLSVHA